ncbi:MAG TPA: hypothetical protein VLC28_08360 [Flavitalea sp.]|nr:hypothetical protein [Flavitalea sp.]
MSDTSSNRGERLFVHIDKTQYLAGEISWFKVYLVDAISHKSSGISKVAYVEILDNANNAVLQGKIAMEHGTGTGSFVIPGTLKTGNYLLRGYTSWMKNFSSDDFFKQPVTIINTRQTYVPDSSLTIRQSTMDFFPESGSLVAGVKSVVAFRYADPSGKGVISSGVIVNNSNDTITTFSSSSQGIGHFEFTPVTGEMYKAVVSGQTGAPGTFSLPSAQEKGFVIHAISQADRVVIEVSTTANEQEGLLVIHQAGQHYFTRKIVLARASSQVEVSKAMLRSGVNTITLFDYKGRAVAERLVFQLPRQLALKTSTANREYGRREKVEVSVGAGRPSNLSASVYQQAPGDEFSQDIFTSLWFAELPQFNGLISTYLNGTSDSLEVFDDLMLTFGYRKLSGQDELRKPSLKYLPEIEAHIVEGMITNIATGKPGNRIMAFLTIPGRTPEFYTSESDSTGLIRFVVSRYYGEAEMIVQTDLRRDSMYKIDIRSPFSDAQHSIIRPYNYNSGVEQWLEKAALAVQVNNHFNSAPLHTYLEHVSDSFLFYRKPFEAYNLDEYKRFTTMDEVLREYVPGIVLRRRGGKNVIDVADYQRKLIFEDPLLLIDGVPVFQSEQLLKYDPLKIRKLEVVTNRYVYGPSVFNGIASWQTYAGDLDGFSPDPRAIVIDYGGLQLQRQYYTPVYETAEQKNSRIPDYRTTLTWNPYIKTNAGSGSFSFFTSDQPGTYKVVVQGLDEQGNAGSSTISFDVK